MTLDARAPHVRLSLKTDDLALARRKRDMLEAADDALWASLTTGSEADPARRRYDAAVKPGEALASPFRAGHALKRLSARRKLRPMR